MSEFKQKTIQGLAWSVVAQGGQQVLNIAIMVILRRLVPPSDFGLVAMTTALTGFAAIFTELGLGAALIQKQDATQEHYSSVFWLNLAAGAALTALTILCAPWIASFYGEPSLRALSIALSSTFLIGSLNIIQNLLLSKALDFKTLSIVEIVSMGVAGAASLTMAAMGCGLWSLAAFYIGKAAGTAALLWILNDWRPTLQFRWRAIRDLMGFSSNYLGTQTVFYWAKSMDSLLLGKCVGKEPLGLYNSAYQIMFLPLANVSMVVSRVMFPAFSKIQSDRAMVKELYLKLTRAIVLLTFPMMLGLFATANPFVLTLFGRDWVRMTPMVKIFCVAGMIQTLGSLNPNLFLSQGQAGLQFRVGLLMRGILVASIVIGLKWGALGVAWGVMLSSALNSLPQIHFSGRLVGLSYFELLRKVAAILACSAAMAAAVLATRQWMLPREMRPTLQLAILVPWGAAIYAALVHGFGLEAYREVRALALEQARGFLARRRGEASA